MWKEQATAILKTKNQRISTPRVEVLAFFINSLKAYSLSHIQRCFARSIDKVTIYRVLHLFVETGLLLKVIDCKGTALYVLNRDSHNESSVHPHLKCKCCEAIICLPDLPNEYLNQLSEYQIENMQFFLEGVCNDCLTK